MDNKKLLDNLIYKGLNLETRIKILNKCLGCSNIRKYKKDIFNIQLVKNRLYYIITNPFFFIDSEVDLHNFIIHSLKLFNNMQKTDTNFNISFYNNTNDIIDKYGYFTLEHLYISIDGTTTINKKNIFSWLKKRI